MRPDNRRAVGDGMKLHLRVRRFAGYQLRLLCLRPELQVAYSTNYYHETWHILGDGRTARLLAHLLWHLSHSRQPGTAILLHAPHARPNPFDAEPSDPLLLLPGHLTHPTPAAVRQLRRSLNRLGPSDRTVRLRSRGAEEERDRAWFERHWRLRRDRAERFDRVGGMLVYRAPPPILRLNAKWFLEFRHVRNTMYLPLAEEAPQDGELQLFRNYSSMVSAAQVARRELADEGVDVARDPELVWDRTERVMERRRRAAQPT